jgi:predicted small lipoprotein YifL
MAGHICGKTVRLLMLLFVLSQMVACGQKGELYLPDEQQSSLTPATLSSATLSVSLLV